MVHNLMCQLYYAVLKSIIVVCNEIHSSCVNRYREHYNFFTRLFGYIIIT